MRLMNNPTGFNKLLKYNRCVLSIVITALKPIGVFPFLYAGCFQNVPSSLVSPEGLKSTPEIYSEMSFLNTKAGARPAWQEACVPGVEKKRFASCRHVATAVPLDLPA